MKAIVTILGVVLLIVAAMYFLVPADSLPTFFPGHETGLMRIRAKHGEERRGNGQAAKPRGSVLAHEREATMLVCGNG